MEKRLSFALIGYGPGRSEETGKPRTFRYSDSVLFVFDENGECWTFFGVSNTTQWFQELIENYSLQQI